jgi:hypothetical protein
MIIETKGYFIALSINLLLSLRSVKLIFQIQKIIVDQLFLTRVLKSYPKTESVLARASFALKKAYLLVMHATTSICGHFQTEIAPLYCFFCSW